MSATTTEQRSGAATPQWLLPTLSFASSLYLYALVALALCAAVAATTQGLAPHVISTGSMQPTIQPGDLVLSEPGRAGLTRGQVVTYEHPEQPGLLVTHRIVGIDDDGMLRTKGDGNRSADVYRVHPEQVTGKAKLIVPLIGLPATWARHSLWIELGLFLLASVVAFAGATMALEDETVETGGSEDAHPVPGSRRPLRERPAVQWVVQHAVAGIGGTAVLVLSAAAVLLDRRSGSLLTDRVASVMVEGATDPVGLLWLVAVSAIVVVGVVVVRRALGTGWSHPSGTSRPPHPSGLARLVWLERHGAGFVTALALFVLMGAGTALAQESFGVFTDLSSSDQSSMSSDVIDPASSLAASVACDGTTPEVTLSWTASPDGSVSGYDVLRSTAAGGPYTTVGSVSGSSTTSYSDSGVANSSTYHYVVRALSTTSWTSDSNEATSTTPDCSPPDMWVSGISGSSVDNGDGQTWTASATTTITGDNGAVGGATVSYEWSGLLDGLVTGSCTTDANGQCTASYATIDLTTTSVTFTVTDVTESNHEYTPASNSSSSVTISKP